MGQYLSAINYFHTSIDLPPAVPKDGRGHYPKGVWDAISGMQKLQVAAAPVGGKRDRVYLPAEHISRILDEALQAYQVMAPFPHDDVERGRARLRHGHLISEGSAIDLLHALEGQSPRAEERTSSPESGRRPT